MTKKKLLKRFKAAVAPLKTFGKSFRFALPRVYLLEGLGALAEGGSLKESSELWTKGLRVAQDLAMTAEVATLEKHLSQTDASSSTEMLAKSMLLTPSAATTTKSKRKSMRPRPRSAEGPDVADEFASVEDNDTLPEPKRTTKSDASRSRRKGKEKDDEE